VDEQPIIKEEKMVPKHISIFVVVFQKT